MGQGAIEKKTLVEDCRRLRASDFQKHRVFKPTVGFVAGSLQWKNTSGAVTAEIGYYFSQDPQPSFTLHYTRIAAATGERQDIYYKISMATTTCRFGGLRYWFLCPVPKVGHPCHRRVVDLYLPPVAARFGCRWCHKLTYRSVQEHDARVDRLRRDPALVSEYLKSKDPRKTLLAVKAGAHLWAEEAVRP